MGWYGEKNKFYTYNKPIDIYDNNSVRKVIFIRLSPSKPHQPVGPNVGAPNIEYNFTTTTTAPNDPIYYQWDWGDDAYSDWLGRYASDEMCKASHTWKEKGTYNIRVKAKDGDGWESDWSDPLPVSMPYDHQTIWGLIIEWVLQLFGITIP